MFKVYGDGYDVSFVFFGIYCLMLGWLVWCSGFFFKVIGVLMMLVGVCYIFNSIVDLIVLVFVWMLLLYLMDLMLIGEVVLVFWLLMFDVR